MGLIAKPKSKTMTMYNWDVNADKANVQLHLNTLNSGIKYYEKREMSEKVEELKKERQSLLEFYTFMTLKNIYG